MLFQMTLDSLFNGGQTVNMLNSVLQKFVKAAYDQVVDSSTMGLITMTLLSKSNQDGKAEISCKRLEDADLGAKIALGFSMMSRGIFPFAKELLESCLHAIDIYWSPSSFEYGLVVAEYIKSCNFVNQELKGISVGSKAIEYRSRIALLAHRIDTTYILLAMTDSYLGVADYDKAMDLLIRAQNTPAASDDLRTIIALRLSKMRRRAGHRVALDSTNIMALGSTIDRTKKMKDDLRHEFFEEILSTESLARANQTTTPDVKLAVNAMVVKSAENSSLEQDWRYARIKAKRLTIHSEQSEVVDISSERDALQERPALYRLLTVLAVDSELSSREVLLNILVRVGFLGTITLSRECSLLTYASRQHSVRR